MSPDISIVIPAYNEEERLAESLPLIREHLEASGLAWEMVLVDDGSKDKTSEVAESLLQGCSLNLLRNEPNLGKGGSIRRGMLESKGKRVLFSDADLSTPITELSKLTAAMDRGADIAIGSRALKDSDLAVRQPFYREMMGRTFNVFVQLLAIRGLKDTQCGFKIFNRDAVDKIFPLQTREGFSFDVEVLALGREFGFEIAEVGVRWLDSPASRVNPIRDSYDMFVDLLRLRRRMSALRKEGVFND